MLGIFDFGFQTVLHSVNYITHVLYRAHSSGGMQRYVEGSAVMKTEDIMRRSYRRAADKHNFLSSY